MSIVTYIPDQTVAYDALGVRESGARLYFYEFNTVIPVALYQDPGGSTPAANPLLSLSDGTWPQVYWDNETRTRVVKQSPVGSTAPATWQVDDIGISDAVLAETFMRTNGTNVDMTDDQKEEFRVYIGALSSEELLSLFNFIPADEQAAIVARNSTYDATGDIRTAIGAAATARAALHVPGGLYNVTPDDTFAAEGGNCKRAFALRSNLEIIADQGATFRVTDGVSTDATPVFMCMFGTNEVLENISLTGLTMDMNGANNKISPDRPVARSGTLSTTSGSTAVVGSGTSFLTQAKAGWLLFFNGLQYTVASVADNTHLTLTSQASSTLSGQAFVAGTWSGLNQSQIMITGTPSGVAARVNNLKIIGNTFINTPGVNCILTGQSNESGSGLGQDQWLTDNTFLNNGLDSADHTSVYCWSDRVVATGNVFDNDAQYGQYGGGGNVAFEMHGSASRFHHNYVRHYYQGMWVAENRNNILENNIIDGNVFEDMKAFGIAFFGMNAIPTNALIGRTKITNNYIAFDDTVHVGVPVKEGVTINTNYQVIDVEITNNTFASGGTTVASLGVAITSALMAGNLTTNIAIEGNSYFGMIAGESITTNATNDLGTIIVKGNKRYNLTPAGIFAVPTGFAATDNASGGSINILVLGFNTCIDDRTVPVCQYGTNITCPIDKFFYYPEVASGMTVANYLDNNLITAREGNTLPFAFTPTFKAGGVAFTLGNGSAIGHITINGEAVSLNATLVVGSSTTIPGGSIAMDLPYVSTDSGEQFMGTWRIAHSGAFNFGGAVVDGTGSTAGLQINGGAFVTKTSPVTLATGDAISIQLTYLRPRNA